MEHSELLQYGVGGGLCYLILKLVLDFLAQWRMSNNDCVQAAEWQKFLVKFSEHHTEDKQLLAIVESLNRAIRDQTSVFASLLATMEAQRSTLTQMALEFRDKYK